jgi:hypothetical protein
MPIRGSGLYGHASKCDRRLLSRTYVAGRGDFSGSPDGVYPSPAVGRAEICLAAFSVSGNSTKRTNIMIGALATARVPGGL